MCVWALRGWQRNFGAPCVICPRDWITLEQLRVKGPKTLPEFATPKQAQMILNACTTLRMQTFFRTLYSLGLRLSEGLSLHVGDIDAERGMVHVHCGKGAKDRCLPIPSATVRHLREFWKAHGHPVLLFPTEG